MPGKEVESETVIKFDGQKQGNLSLAYLSSGVNTPHSDLTFYCRDGQVAGHKLVLASLSPFLHTLLQRHWLQVCVCVYLDWTELVAGHPRAAPALALLQPSLSLSCAPLYR